MSAVDSNIWGLLVLEHGHPAEGMAPAMLGTAPLFDSHRHELVVGTDLLQRPDNPNWTASPDPVVNAERAHSRSSLYEPMSL